MRIQIPSVNLGVKGHRQYVNGRASWARRVREAKDEERRKNRPPLTKEDKVRFDQRDAAMFLEPSTPEERSRCIADGATTPRARDAIVRRMRSSPR